jgi:hypothetical protein
MIKIDKQDLLSVMADIAPGSGTAESESNDDQFFLNFLPVPSYRSVLEPDILLILGGRGAGKTELFRLLARPTGREILRNRTHFRSSVELTQTIWVAAFGRPKQQEKQFPSPETVDLLMKNADPIRWRAFWLGLILGILIQKENLSSANWTKGLSGSCLAALRDSLSMPSQWFSFVINEFEQANHALDVLDNSLIEENKWLFVTYDELDRLVPSHADLALPIKELLAFWLDRWRRWERIRPKIFLRTDLFQDEFLGFPDASKLQGHQVRLEWSAIYLYQLFIKRLANSSFEMRNYVGLVRGLLGQEDPHLGVIPTLDEHLFERFMEQLVGEFMGAGPRKGYTFSWIPNHLQDAGGRIAPRSFLKLFATAAERKLGSLKEVGNVGLQLLQPSDLQGSLMKTSADRIAELAQEEYPWLEALKASLEDLEVPMPTPKFLEVLRTTSWSKDPSKRPPSTEAYNILRRLAQLGVVELRLDGRINVPEIYLYGFKLKRRGGIKRPK